MSLCVRSAAVSFRQAGRRGSALGAGGRGVAGRDCGRLRRASGRPAVRSDQLVGHFAAHADASHAFGDTVLEEIARGGMGVVYRLGKSAQPDRCLEDDSGGAVRGQQEVLRFRREAKRRPTSVIPASWRSMKSGRSKGSTISQWTSSRGGTWRRSFAKGVCPAAERRVTAKPSPMPFTILTSKASFTAISNRPTS